MDISLTGVKVELTPVMEEYIYKKLAKLEKLHPKLLKCQVIVKQERYLWHTEMNLEVKGSSLHAKGEGEDFRSAVDEAKSKITRQLKSFKGKRVSQHHRENARYELGAVK